MCQLWICKDIGINNRNFFFFRISKKIYIRFYTNGITAPIQCYSYVLNNRNSNPVTGKFFSLFHHRQCGCDSYPFSCYTGYIYFSPEQGGEIVKGTTHVCKVNSLGMGGYFPSVSHTSLYDTETQLYRHRNCIITRGLQ